MMTTPINSPEELIALRSTNAELLKKSKDRKAKLAEHEATITDLKARLTIAETALADATVGAPLRGMAAALSPVPDLWLAEFAKHYKAEMKGGKLQVLDMEGKPVMDGDQEVPFENQAIAKLLGNSDKDELASFAHIMFGSRASGGGAVASQSSGIPHPEKQQEKTATMPQFGLR
jgi:hypothetical protein